MEKGLLGTALHRVRVLAAQERYADLSDGALLERWTNGPDEAALTTLVERHGAMVHGVCARIVHDRHDAEDACQATFLVLARKARSIRKQASVACWLHGVARRVSLTLVRDRGERARREANAPNREPDATALRWADVQIVLDEELTRLPERLRGPLVLCYFEGKTRDEAAHALGLSQGRLHGYLQRGRTILRDRLTKRGITLGGSFLSASLVGEACQALPPVLAVQIVHGAMAALGGHVLPSTHTSVRTTLLTQDVLRTMTIHKLKTTSAWAIGIVATVALLGGSLLSAGSAQPLGDEPPTTPPKMPTEESKVGTPVKPKPKALELRDLQDAEYVFHTTHVAKHPKVAFPSSAIPDAAYAVVQGEKDRTIRFDQKGRDVSIVGENVTGSLEKSTDQQRSYDLKKGLFAGGQFAVTQTKEGLVATYTIYGSGVPVIASYRGMLVAKEPAKGALLAPTFRKTQSIVTDSTTDFRYAVLAVSTEQQALLSRNYIVSRGEKAESSGLHIWHFDGDKTKRTQIGDGTQFGFIPNSTLAFNVSWGSGVEFWDTRTHKQVGKALPHELREDSTMHPAVSPDGSVMVTRSKLAKVQFWNLKTREAMTPAQDLEAMVLGFEFSSDGRWFFSGNAKGQLHVWEAKTGKQVAGPIAHTLVGYRHAYHATTQVLLTAENNKRTDPERRSNIIVRSSKDWQETRRIEVPCHVRDLRWIDDTRFLVVGDDRKPEEGRPYTYGRNVLYIVDTQPKQAEVQTLVKDGRFLTQYASTPDGKHLIVNTQDGTTTCWKVGDAKPLWTKAGEYDVRCNDPNWVLLVGRDNVLACSLPDGKELWKQPMGDHVLLEGSKVWLFGAEGIAVWQVERPPAPK